MAKRNYKGKRVDNRQKGGKSDYKDRRNNGRRGDDRDFDERSADKRLTGLNDMSWYNRNPLLTQAAASLPFPYRPGMEISVKSGWTSYEIPGVMGINWLPTIGQASKPTDPAAIAGKEVYAQVRNAFSGSLDADAPDFMIYFMALDSIFSYIGALKRVFRIINTYTYMNYDVPDVVLRSMGFTPAMIGVLKSDRMSLFQAINELIGMTHKFRCPAVFDIFNRHYWMNDNVYTDAESANSQMYVFVQQDYYQFALKDTPAKVQAGGLTMVGSPFESATTIAALYEFGRGLINALAASDDAYTISGYLTRAYDGTPVFSVDEITLTEAFAPVYVPEVLAQIENATQVIIGNGIFTIQTNDVSQDPATNSLICNPKVANSTSILLGMNPMLSVRSDTPTLTDVVEATRLKTYTAADGTIYSGSEIVTGYQVFLQETMNDGGWAYPQYVQLDMTKATAANLYTLVNLARVTQFDWSPLGVVAYQENGASGDVSVMLNGDIHNVTVFQAEQLHELHKVCLYSEFNSFSMR